ncbi:hypothetical protein B0I35DRAFT_8408 [Stachybotrys elegans]|uniref:Uncharacterized protein n=1 Tax=Stachybotrys elegans TaxID=80388 RepID=A0A8K0T4W2_9HYPO|nr:hypothetical protein B0I35DRAFT_8408 [Stachybotrys elegans]
MLSSGYHITYWVIALVAVAAHHTIRCIIGAAAETFFHTLAFPSLAAALYIIWCGPREKPASLLQNAVHQTTAGFLLISLGSITQHMPPSQDLSDLRYLFHACLAFNAAGTLEAIRQNRRDIDPASVMQLLEGPRTKLARLTCRGCIEHSTACLALLALFRLLMCGIDLALHAIYASDLNCWFIWSESVSHMQHSFGSFVLLTFVIAALVDLAETVKMIYLLSSSLWD